MNCIQAHIGFADVRFHSVQEASVRSIRTTLVPVDSEEIGAFL